MGSVWARQVGWPRGLLPALAQAEPESVCLEKEAPFHLRSLPRPRNTGAWLGTQCLRS